MMKIIRLWKNNDRVLHLVDRVNFDNLHFYFNKAYERMNEQWQLILTNGTNSLVARMR